MGTICQFPTRVKRPVERKSRVRADKINHALANGTPKAFHYEGVTIKGVWYDITVQKMDSGRWCWEAKRVMCETDTENDLGIPLSLVAILKEEPTVTYDTPIESLEAAYRLLSSPQHVLR
jgi:hypothetical protein